MGGRLCLLLQDQGAAASRQKEWHMHTLISWSNSIYRREIPWNLGTDEEGFGGRVDLINPLKMRKLVGLWVGMGEGRAIECLSGKTESGNPNSPELRGLRGQHHGLR